MSLEEKTCLKLGRMITRMIRDLRSAGDVRAYGRHQITFPGATIQLILANNVELAELFDRVADGIYNVATAIPPSQVN
jgi:hypothetical protein